MEKDDLILVEVAYARPDQQTIIELEVEPGTTIDQAIAMSDILEAYPEIDLAQNKVGVFGKLAKPNTVLHEGDRVEIYRPLIADPKEVRRKRAAKGKKTKKGAAEINKSAS
jgi:putative ubiquitin-RnfH superfamily antitoxin RatB of RatAB toxin-antitoxin module